MCLVSKAPALASLSTEKALVNVHAVGSSKDDVKGLPPLNQSIKLMTPASQYCTNQEKENDICSHTLLEMLQIRNKRVASHNTTGN